MSLSEAIRIIEQSGAAAFLPKDTQHRLVSMISKALTDSHLFADLTAAQTYCERDIVQIDGHHPDIVANGLNNMLGIIDSTGVDSWGVELWIPSSKRAKWPLVRVPYECCHHTGGKARWRPDLQEQSS